jgi:hypothetical protein
MRICPLNGTTRAAFSVFVLFYFLHCSLSFFLPFAARFCPSQAEVAKHKEAVATERAAIDAAKAEVEAMVATAKDAESRAVLAMEKADMEKVSWCVCGGVEVWVWACVGVGVEGWRCGCGCGCEKVVLAVLMVLVVLVLVMLVVLVLVLVMLLGAYTACLLISSPQPRIHAFTGRLLIHIASSASPQVKAEMERAKAEMEMERAKAEATKEVTHAQEAAEAAEAAAKVDRDRWVQAEAELAPALAAKELLVQEKVRARKGGVKECERIEGM